MFELTSKALAYIGTFVNLSARGQPNIWADGKERTLHKALQVRAYDREFILDELANIKQFYSGISRHTRNETGPVSGFAYLITASAALSKPGAEPFHPASPAAVYCQLILQTLERQRYRAQIPWQIFSCLR